MTAIHEMHEPATETPGSPQSQLALMQAVARQDLRAQAALVERLSARVLYVSRRLCSSRQDAEDAAQASLLEILKSAGTFRVETSLERWADRITARTALRANQRERQRNRLLERWLVPRRLPWGTSLHTTHQSSNAIEVLLAQLPEKRREALVMHHVFGYTIDEIAELTGAPRGTVKDRLNSARRHLRRVLTRDERSVDRNQAINGA